MEEIHNIVISSVQDKLTEQGIPASQLPDIISNLAKDGHLSNFITTETLENVKHFANTDNLEATFVSLDGVLSLIDSLLVSSPKQDSLLDEEPLEEISFMSTLDSPRKDQVQPSDGITPKISRTNKFKRPRPAHKVVRSSSSVTDLSDYYPSDNELQSPSTSSPPQTPNLDNIPDSYNNLNGLMLSSNSQNNDALIQTQNQIRELEKRNNELEKRLKESERSYTQTTSQNEDYISVMEDQLKDNDMKLEALAREEKDLRAKDRQNMVTINKLEHDIATYQRQTESARIQAGSLQNQVQDVNAEIDSLRDSLREKDRDVRESRSRADRYEHEIKKWENERKGYEDALQRIKSQLDIARKSERVLEVQKSENVGLKETIDRLRGDLSHQLTYSGTSQDDNAGQLGSVSRNLGKELARQLTEVDNSPGRPHSSEPSEGEIETIVTTRRRKVKPSISSLRNIETDNNTDSAESPPPYSQGNEFEIVDDVKKVTNRGVQATPESKTIETQTSTDEDKPTNGRIHSQDSNKSSFWKKLSSNLTFTRRTSVSHTITIYSTIIFLCGMIGGAWILPSTTSSLEAVRSLSGYDDKALFVAYNTFDGASTLLNSDGSLTHFLQTLVWNGLDSSQLFPS